MDISSATYNNFYPVTPPINNVTSSSSNLALPPSQNISANEHKLADWQEQFIEAALARLRKEPLPQVELPNQSDPEFCAAVECTLHKGCYSDTGQGGEHKWVSTNKIPGYLFKYKLQDNGQPNQTMLERVALIERGRKICEENNLFLLYVPKSSTLSTDESVMIEEKLDIKHKWKDQKELYRWVMNEPRLEPYAKEILRQLAIFICNMRYNDVKYTNNPLTNDGRVGLIDLDERGFGFVGYEKFHGLFHIIPLKWYDEYAELALSLLPENKRDYYKKLICDLKAYYEKREKDSEEKQRYYTSKGITKTLQPLEYDKEKLKALPPQIGKCAEMLMREADEKLKYQYKPLNIKKGRSLAFRDTNLPRHSIDPDYWNFRLDILPKALEALKQLGLIYSYVCDKNTPNLWVVC